MGIEVRKLVLLIVGGSIIFITSLFAFLWSLPKEGKPTLDNEFAIKLIKEFYIKNGMDLDKLSSNYLNTNNEAGIFSYIYRQKYDGWKFVVRIFHKPANIYLSECFIRENKVLGCNYTEEGYEFVQKYS